jgi:hypothetical protein
MAAVPSESDMEQKNTQKSHLFNQAKIATKTVKTPTITHHSGLLSLLQ